MSDILVIDVCDDVETVIDNIRKCKKTLSSSLHGIIVSHAYGINCAWIKLSNYVYGDDVKFLDYYYSLNLRDIKEPIFLRKTLNEKNDKINYLISLVENYPNPQFPINSDTLLRICPF